MEQPLDTLMHCISTAASRGEERDRQREKKGEESLPLPTHSPWTGRVRNVHPTTSVIKEQEFGFDQSEKHREREKKEKEEPHDRPVGIGKNKGAE